MGGTAAALLKSGVWRRRPHAQFPERIETIGAAPVSGGKFGHFPVSTTNG
jgi:hypothetical protein